MADSGYRRLRRGRIGIILGLALSASGLAVAFPVAKAAPAPFSESFTVPVHADLDTTWDCSNHPGPTITIGGTLAYGNATLRIDFTNNKKWTHDFESQQDVVFGVTPTGGSITVPKQPAIKFNTGTFWGQGVGGNPWISFQFVDSNGNPLDSPFLLGRCVQGPSFGHISTTLTIPVNATLTFTALSCTNDKSDLIFGGNGSHIGLAGFLYLDNNINKVVHRATSTADFGVTLDSSIIVPKGGAAGGAGGNPWIWVTIFSDTTSAGTPTLLGRCHDLS